MASASLSTMLRADCSGEPQKRANGLTRYMVALGVFAVAAVVSRTTIQLGGGQVGLYAPLLVAVVAAAWFGGVGPALICQICSALFAWDFLHQGTWWTPAARETVYGLSLFLIIGKLALFLTASLCWNRRLREAEQHFRLIATATNDCLWDWDLRTNRIRYSGNLTGLFGLADREIDTDFEWWRGKLAAKEADRVSASRDEVLANGGTQCAQEYWVRREDGSHILVADRAQIIRDSAGKAIRMIGGMSDITVNRKTEERLAHDRLHDTLTGLPNRQYFREQLEQAMGARSENRRVGVLFIDLDRFKVVNDSLGHVIGDKLLNAVSKRIAMATGPNEIVARFGGNVFTVLLEKMENPAEAVALAKRVQESIGYPCELEGHAFTLTASIGIALADHELQPEEVLRHADIAMYRAKARGRARYEIFQSALDAPVMNVFQVESEFRKAIGAGQLRLFYQPIVEIATGKIGGFEALLRWQHPTRGLLLPVAFLPIAEESGIIGTVGRWVIETACERLAVWRKSSGGSALRMSINVAEKQLADPGFFDFVRTTLEKNRLDGSQLVLELTENIIVDNDEAARAEFQKFRSLGIGLAIDDFGKGHSSLGRLQDLPLAILKIDGAFVSRIREGKPEIVDAIIALAHQLKMEVTAECVETREQFEHLKRSRCTSAQGLYFSDALSAEAAGELLENGGKWDEANRACA